MSIPVTVPVTVSHPQEDEQEDQEEEDGPKHPVDHGRGDGDGDVPQSPHPAGAERLAAVKLKYSGHTQTRGYIHQYKLFYD